jgi:hypothetical protein
MHTVFGFGSSSDLNGMIPGAPSMTTSFFFLALCHPVAVKGLTKYHHVFKLYVSVNSNSCFLQDVSFI